MNTMIYAALHLLVDFVCAWSMFACFGREVYANLLIYNFCAFALQMPLGTLADLCKARLTKTPIIYTAAGTLLTVVGSLLHPAILGIGNALFHVGGGMEVIAEDFAKQRNGRNLGLFVAPGAIGLYLGTVLGKSDGSAAVLLAAAVIMVVLLAFLILCAREYDVKNQETESSGSGIGIVAVCCFAVVVLRSWIGLGVSFPWKAIPVFGFSAVLCAAGGKFFGGVLASRFGLIKTASVSLLLAAACYLLAEAPLFGLLASLLFNMSMPLTLYLLVRKLPHMPGFSFGLLTFGLFLGFLPVYFQIPVPMPGNILGVLGGIISFVLMCIGGKAANHGKVPA